MASVASASPSGQSFLRANSSDETDSWQYVDNTSSPAGYIPSPSSSFNGWGMVGYPNHQGTSPAAMSPLPPPTSHPNQQGTLNSTTDENGNSFLSFLDSQQLMANHELLFPDLLGGAMDAGLYQSGIQDGSLSDLSGFDGIDMQAQSTDLDIPIQFQDDSNVAPWAPMNLGAENFVFVGQEDVSAQMSRTPSQKSIESYSHHSSPGIPSAKSRPTKGTNPVKKFRGSSRVEKRKPAAVDNFVIVTPTTIHQQAGKPNPYECFEVTRGIQRGRKGPLAGKAAESALNIRKMGACFCCRSRKVKCDEERPCKNCKKIAAQVPQIVCWQFSDFMPVLFPGFIRGHFKKDAMARFISDNVSEFYAPPSASGEPYFIELSSGPRFHSTLTLPASFFTPKSAEVLQHWHLGTGIHQLDLHARAALPIGVDPRDNNQKEALRRRTREYVNNLVNEAQYAEQVTDALRGTQLPRRVLSIVQHFTQRSQCSMVKRALAIYATHYVLTRQLCLTPGTLARLHGHGPATTPLHAFLASSSPMNMNMNMPMPMTTRILNRQVKAVLDEHLLKETQALFTSFGSALKPRSRAEWAACLATFLVLCLLFEGIEAAADTFVVSEAEIALRNATARRHHQNTGNGSMFAATGSETATARPGTDENKVGGGGGFAVGGRRQALDLCREIDNLPFRQVAYRFHVVYQTHAPREPGVAGAVGGSGTVNGQGNGNGNGGVNANAGASATFNPLVDASLDADLEPAAAEMAASLRALLEGDDSWHELDFLTADPILSQAEAHPYPRDITLDYTGRLLARFLLSFTDERYLFDGQY
ncbi:hypothetical protein F4777DRAFT_600761 [Nemania sp. FL0916]|nr:hypothetical protein F4777DRAFT_600761 [Nemania sp. FL0916]